MVNLVKKKKANGIDYNKYILNSNYFTIFERELHVAFEDGDFFYQATGQLFIKVN